MTDKKLIPFNLDRAMAGDTVITRDGRKVLQIAHFPLVNKDERIVAQIEGDFVHFGFSENGSFIIGEISINDLFMAPKTKTYWANVYRYKDGLDVNSVEIGGIYGSEGDAIQTAGHENFAKIISFEIEEE